MIGTGTRRPRGRPRAFDEDNALDAAVALFSRIGFAGVSISDLTEATGLTAGSLYKAYSDKEGIFARALDRYVALREADIAQALATETDGRAKIARLLHLYAELSRGDPGRRGCMVVAGVTELDQFGTTAEGLRAILARRRKMLGRLVADGQGDGSIHTADDPERVADVLLSLLQGMRVVGKGGQFPVEADAFVRLALKVLD